MIIKDKEGYKKHKKIKSAISLALASLTPVTMAGCSSETININDSNMELGTSFIDSDNEIYGADFFGNRLEYYEFDDLSDLNSTIDKIKAVNYQCSNKDFVEYDIYNKPTNEINSIVCNNLYGIYNPNDCIPNYNWYNNGIIDVDSLYNKILENNTAAGINNTDDVKSYARVICDAIVNDILYIKNKYSNFNFNISLYNINNLTIDTITNEWFYSAYDSHQNKIILNLDFESDYNKLEINKIARHETNHLIMNGAINMERLYVNGISIDDLCTSEAPLEQNVILEFYAEKAARESLGMKEDYNTMEKSIMSVVCKSTGKDLDYYESCVYGFSQNGLISAFEEELANPNFVFSTFNAFDAACGYGYFPNVSNDTVFNNDCFNYAAINLMKNAYIRNLKEYTIGDITYDEAIYNINGLKTSLEECYGLNYNSVRAIEELTSIFDSYVQNYSRSR